jgi:putative cardiolipin synthase
MKLPRLFIAIIIALLSITTVHAQSISDWIHTNCEQCTTRMSSQTGAYILEKGEESLIGRAWLAQHATESIDIQYFIWSTDNIGILAAEQLLGAAERGVRVRVLVDDLLIDAENRTLLLLSGHPNVHIRIYNPNLAVGVSTWQKIKNVFSDFRAINQRMHDKTAIFDNVAGITGGRNMADEYFDYDHEYNFRDRDILLIGAAVQDMTDNFEEFWESEYAVPVQRILAEDLDEISAADSRQRAEELHAYAADPRNFAPEVREAIDATDQLVETLLQHLVWDDMAFISDIPGKNAGDMGLGGSGESTRLLIAALQEAEKEVLIQSPYLVMPEGGIRFFNDLVDRGVRIRISTNSLASTDNIQAFSGYASQRKELLRAGIQVYEYKPYPATRKTLTDRHPAIAKNNTVFALHAKSLVIDDKVLYIGTFNLDPRSANLNTEVGVLVENEQLAQQLAASIEHDIRPENSWRTTLEFNPDDEVGRGKRFRVMLNRMLPIEPIL